jgi:hypothetical protein
MKSMILDQFIALWWSCRSVSAAKPADTRSAYAWPIRKPPNPTQKVRDSYFMLLRNSNRNSTLPI